MVEGQSNLKGSCFWPTAIYENIHFHIPMLTILQAPSEVLARPVMALSKNQHLPHEEAKRCEVFQMPRWDVKDTLKGK